MRTYTWTVEGNEKKLEIYPNFVRFGNKVFMDGEYDCLEISPNQQILLLKEGVSRFEIPFENEKQAQEAMDLLLRTWYPVDFEDEMDEPKELTPEQIAAVRLIVHDEWEATVEEGRQMIRGACRNTCGRLAGFVQHLTGRAFYHATQFGVRVYSGVEAWWRGPEAAFTREHTD